MYIVNVGVNLTPGRGGIYQTVTEMVRVFQDGGNETRVLAFGTKEGVGPFESPVTFVETSSLPLLRKYYFWPGAYTGGFESVLGCPDLVFIHGLFYHGAAAAAAYCRERRIPYILVSHGSLDPYVFTYRSIRKRVWTTTYRHRLLVDAAAVLFSTRAEALKAAKWTAGSRTEAVHWPVEAVSDYDKRGATTELLARYGLREGTRVALFCGRLDPMKRPIETVREFKATATEEWALVLVGPPSDGLALEEVKRACREPGPKCICAGPSYGDALMSHFRGAELLILWSHRENFSHVVAEALAHAVPVFISSGVDLIRDLAPVDCAFRIPDDGAESVRSAFRRVLRMSVGELASAGRRGCEWTRKELSRERFTQQLTGLCDSASRGRSGGLR